MSAKGFLEAGMAETLGKGEGGFFVGNKLVKVCVGLDGFALGSEGEKMTLLK
jgi:SCY1-like protein 1